MLKRILTRTVMVRGRDVVPVSRTPPSGLSIIPPQEDGRYIIGNERFSSEPITSPAFRVHGSLRTNLGRSGEAAILTAGTYYGVEDGLNRLQFTRGAFLAGSSRGHHDWCKGWPVVIVQTPRDLFAVYLDLRQGKGLGCYQVERARVRNVEISETVTKRRTVWR
ncbi:hypothetical protein [Methylorubrum sp. SB2]|uniref:hypothetical protein n=1 Tax=Methylorubrum subtropicum TaxID=3138812 RepID=UPI00313F3DBA